MVRVQHVLESWKAVREDTARAVEDLPDGDVSFRPVDGVAGFGEIAEHILQAGHGLTGLMLEGIDNFATPEFRESLKRHYWPLKEGAGQAELAAALRGAVDERAGVLVSAPAEFFAGVITRFDGQQVTRLEMLQFVKEHELTHRAQLFLFLRLKGVVPATTRRRLARK